MPAETEKRHEEPLGALQQPVKPGAVVLAVLVVGLFVWLLLGSIDSGVFTGSQVVTAAEFAQLRDGITYTEAVRIIGAGGTEISRTELLGVSTVMYAWTNSDGSNMNAMFQGGKMISKAQFGLR